VLIDVMIESVLSATAKCLVVITVVLGYSINLLLRLHAAYRCHMHCPSVHASTCFQVDVLKLLLHKQDLTAILMCQAQHNSLMRAHGRLLECMY
jgi:hypothetical protein